MVSLLKHLKLTKWTRHFYFDISSQHFEWIKTVISHSRAELVKLFIPWLLTQVDIKIHNVKTSLKIELLIVHNSQCKIKISRILWFPLPFIFHSFRQKSFHDLWCSYLRETRNIFFCPFWNVDLHFVKSQNWPVCRKSDHNVESR